MTLINAVVSICMLAGPMSGSCETRQFKVTPSNRVCHMGTLHVEAPVGGGWAPVTITVSCGENKP